MLSQTKRKIQTITTEYRRISIEELFNLFHKKLFYTFCKFYRELF